MLSFIFLFFFTSVLKKRGTRDSCVLNRVIGAEQLRWLQWYVSATFLSTPADAGHESGLCHRCNKNKYLRFHFIRAWQKSFEISLIRSAWCREGFATSAMSVDNDYFEDYEDQLPQDLEDDVVQEVLKSGTDLRQYSRQIEKELKEVENKSIQDYIKESQNIASLHNQIAACDNILEVCTENFYRLAEARSYTSIIDTLESTEVKQSKYRIALKGRLKRRTNLKTLNNDLTTSSALRMFSRACVTCV